MNQKNILLLLNLFHIIIILAPYGVYFTDNKLYAKLIWLEILTIYLGWLIFNGKCFISEIEKNIIKKINPKISKGTIKDYENNIVNYYLKKFFNIDGNLTGKIVSATYWISIYLSIYYTTMKLDILDQGLSLILYSVVVYNFKEKLF